MDANNPNNLGEGAGGSNMERVPVQPRQPQNLQGLLRFAIEARQEDSPAQEVALAPMDNQRREFLEEALQSMVMDAVVVLRHAIPVLTDVVKIGSLADKEEISHEVKAAFESVLDVIEDLDVANDFCRLRGFDAFTLCYNTRNSELWVYTNDLLAGVCQNFAPGQVLALERGLLKKQLELLQDPDTKHKEKFVYALSCCVREHPPGCRALLALGGCEVLAPLISAPEDQRLKTKAACLLRHLLHHYPEETKERIITLNLPQILAREIDQNIGQATEHLLNLLRTCVDSTPEVLTQCRDPNVGLKRILQNVLTAPSIVDDAEQNREIIEYASETLALVFGNEETAAYDCEEEADR